MKSITIKTVAVIGAGKAGRAFAFASAKAGFNTVLEDVMPANLRQAQTEFISFSSLSNQYQLQISSTVEDAVYGADLVVDFVPDELESKLEIFSLLDRMAPPRTIFCTPTANISITDLASCIYRPNRCLGIRGTLGEAIDLLYLETTSSDILAAARSFFEKLGNKVSTKLDPDLPVLRKNLVYTR